MPLRQTTGFVENLLKLVGLSWEVPNFNTLCRRQKTLNVNLQYRGGAGPLNMKRLAIKSHTNHLSHCFHNIIVPSDRLDCH